MSLRSTLFHANAALFVALIAWAVLDQVTHPVRIDVVEVPAVYQRVQRAEATGDVVVEAAADEAEVGAEQGDEPALLPLHAEAREAFRSGDTATAIRLISQAIERVPDAAILRNDLGVYLLNAGKLEDAERAFRQALSADPEYIRGFYNLGTVLFKKERYAAAAQAFSEALARNPHYGAARFNRALAHERMGDRQAAERDYRALIETDRSATSAKGHYNLGVLLARQGRANDAIAAFRGALRLRPDYASARYNTAVLLARLGRTAEAVQDYEKLLSLEPDHRAAALNLGALLMREKQWKKAEAHFDVLTKRISDEPKFAYNLALCRVQLGDDAGAVEALRHALRIRPEYAEAHYNLGLAYKRLGKTQPSVEHFARAAELKPQEATYHYNLALALAEADRVEEAIAQYREAVRLDPNYFRAVYNLALLEYRAGRYDEARGDFETAVQLRPDGYNANYNLGLTLLKLGDAEAAVPVFETAVKLDGTLEAHYSLGLALGRSGRHRKAVEQYRAALEQDPKHARSIERLAESLSALGDHERALSRLALLQKLDPSDPSAFNLGLALYRSGNYEQAIGYFDLAAAGDGEIRKKALNMRGAALAKSGRPEQAIASYRRALELAPHDGLIVRNLARALELEGKHREAIEELLELQKTEPGHHLTSYLLGRQYEALGQRERAAAQYRRALELDPEDAEARAALAALNVRAR